MSRLSVRYFPKDAAKKRDIQAYAFMFIRDLPLDMMPIRHYPRDASFNVSLDPDNSELEETVSKLLNTERVSRSDITDTLIEFVDELTGFLAKYGEAYFELVDIDDSQVDEGLSNKKLEILPDGKIFRTRKYYLQLIPATDREDDRPKYIKIPKQNIWHIKLPKDLGSPRQHRTMIRKLNRFSEPMPKFAMESKELGQDSGYEFSSHRKEVDKAIEALTIRWGTIPSIRQPKGTTEYYLMENRLKYSYAQALIREHIFNEINKLLAQSDIGSKIVVNGLPKADDIKDALKKLERGEIGFVEALAAVKMP